MTSSGKLVSVFLFATGGWPFGNQFFQLQQTQVHAVQNQSQTEREKRQHHQRRREDGARHGVDVAFGDEFIARPEARQRC